jgi:hypothetical protein
VTAAKSGEAEARRHHRHSRRRPAGPDAGNGGGAAWPALPGVFAGSGFAGLRRRAECDLRRICRCRGAGTVRRDVDVITYEFENVPAASAMILAARRPVLPNRKILETTQDRLARKDFVTASRHRHRRLCRRLLGPTLRAAIAKIGLPAVLKTRRFGYDGKGQAIIREGDDPDRSGRTSHQIGDPGGLRSVRARDFGDRRAQRRRPGRMLRRHRKRAPRPHPEDLAGAGGDLRRAGGAGPRHRREDRDALDYVGVLAVEMFVVPDDGPENPGQRDRAAGAQFRPLDAGRRLDLAIRAAYPRHCRLAARQAGPARPRSP